MNWIRSFRERGYHVFRGMLPDEVLREAREALAGLVERHARDLAVQGLNTTTFEDETFDTRFWRVYENHLGLAPKSFRRELHLEGLFHLFFHPPLLDRAEEILGPEIRLYPNYTARPKLPEWAGTEVLWHQDGGYTSPEAGRLRMVNVWAALAPCRVEHGCMEFVPGTHRLGVVPHEQREHYLEIAPDVLAQHVSAAFPIETDPGDVVVFDNLLFHRGLPNRSNRIRWSLDWRYQDATQPTMRAEEGHLARSGRYPQWAVASSQEWAARSFR